jgi:diguanylate cyclase (GGDEF)-like protein
MGLLSTIAVIDISSVFSGLLQFLVVVAVSFGVISLITSFVRFQIITGDFAGEGVTIEDAEKAANKFQVEVLRRLAGARSTPPPFCLVHVGLMAREALEEEQGREFITEVQEYLHDTIRNCVRRTDSVFMMDDLTVTLLVGDCERQKITAMAERVVQDIYSRLYRAASGWSGHVAIHAGCASYPENGRAMQELIEMLSQAFDASWQGEHAVVLADVPVVEEDPEEDEETIEAGQELAVDDEEDEEDEDAETISPLVDPLTGVLKADRVGSAMQKYMAGFRRAGEPVAMLYFTIDRLAKYRRQYGDEVMDALLAAVGDVLQRMTRETDLLGRYGDHSFVAMLNCPTSNALGVGRRVCAAIRRERVAFRNLPLRITVSAGVAGYPEHGRTPRELLHLTDVAAQEAQGRGGDSVVMYDSGLKGVKPHKEAAAGMVDQF